jgi:hypothetical protein
VRQRGKIKRPRSGYQLFFADANRRLRFVKGLTRGATFAIVGAQWRRLGEEEKDKYRALAVGDRERYEREVAEREGSVEGEEKGGKED